MDKNDKFSYNRKILKQYKFELSTPKRSCPKKVELTVSYIHENLFENIISVTDVKEDCSIYEKDFACIFYLYTGFYPKEYIIHHQITLSKQLLKYETNSITEVALLVGFSSHSAFCNTFKRKVGVCPSEWRDYKDKYKEGS